MQVTIRLRDGEHVFSVDPGEKLLYAGLRQGVPLAYECATGTCGTCKADRVSGKVGDDWCAAPGLPDRTRHPDSLLLCQCHAEGDCVLRADGWPPTRARPLAQPDYGLAHIVGLRSLTADVCLLTLSLPRPIDFEAGQFVLLGTESVPGLRAYSIVEGRATAQPSFIIKRKPGGGMSDWLFGSARPGAALRLFGPLEVATFRPASDGDLILLAGASGLSMALSVLDAARRAGHFEHHRADVIFGVRRAADLFLLDRLAASGAAVTIALSEPETDLGDVLGPLSADYPAFRFVGGFVHEVAMAALPPSRPSTIAFLAGPPPMIDACLRHLITRARVPPGRIRYDKFS